MEVPVSGSLLLGPTSSSRPKLLRTPNVVAQPLGTNLWLIFLRTPATISV